MAQKNNPFQSAAGSHAHAANRSKVDEVNRECLIYISSVVNSAMARFHAHQKPDPTPNLES